METTWQPPPLPLVLLFLVLLSANSQPLPSVLLNSSVAATTENASIGLFTGFQSLDIAKPHIGLGGQLLYRLEIPSDLSSTHVAISTCQGSNFDTYLALLDKNPQIQQDVKVLSESGNDINCSSRRNRAFISTTVSPGIYFILITGNADQQGTFNISVTATSATPPPVPWGLDRIDQRRLPLDGKYDVTSSGGRVWIYLIDSGVRTSHEEFEGRAQNGYDFVNNKESSAPDCTGHGTHVAGIIAGKTYGVSKQARLVSVRVFDCNNTARISAIVDALGWSLIDARLKERTNVIIAMMFSTTTVRSSLLQSAVLGLRRSGVPVVVPAGNNGRDACGFYPGSMGAFLTVGSIDIQDARSRFSNFGNCTKIYAPGSSIVSSWHNSDNSWRYFSGTAQAAAHVTGVVSNLMDLNPMLKAEMIYDVIESISTLDSVENIPSSESTRLAFVRSVPEFTGNTPPPAKEVYIFIILRFKTFACSEETEEISKIKNVFADEVGTKKSKILLTCTTNNEAGTSADSSLVELRFQLSERTAVADFTLLENLLFLGKAALEQRLGLPFDVVEEPWVVDSTLTVFWGAPTFSDVESSGLSSGAIAGIVVGVLFLFSFILMVACIIYRRYAKLDVIQSMEGSGDFDKGPVTFFDYENNGTGGSNMMMRSFRNVVRSLSFRRPGGGRKSTLELVEQGLNRMNSYIGGTREKVGRDLVRVASFGGEAFAEFTSDLRKSSRDFGTMFEKRSKQQDQSSSFRGANNVVLEPKSRSSEKGSFSSSDFGEADERDLDESLQMRSFGGEAFAMIGLQTSLGSQKSSTSDGERKGSSFRAVQTEVYGREELANTEGGNRSSGAGSSDQGSSHEGSSGRDSSRSSSSHSSSFFHL